MNPAPAEVVKNLRNVVLEHHLQKSKGILIIKKTYKERLNLPLDGLKDIEFFTKTGMLVAKGYLRVVIGDRGPYVEFNPKQIVASNFHIPKDQEYRKVDKRVYYIEARSNDAANVKLYYQKKIVTYADYLPGLCYLSPFELTSDKIAVLVDSLQ